MKSYLTTFAALVLTGCGLMPPKAVTVEENLVSPAKICGKSSEVFAILFYDNIVANVIAVDQQLAPEFEEEKENLVGIETLPNLNRYCVLVAEGEHQLTILAERESGIGTMAGTSYYIGQCTFALEANADYYTVPKRSGEWLSDLVVLFTKDDQDVSAGVCDMIQVSREHALHLIESLRVNRPGFPGDSKPRE